MEEKIIEIEKANFESFKTQLELYIDKNFQPCRSFLDGIKNASSEKSLKRHFEDYSEYIFSKLGGDDYNDDIHRLERKIDKLNWEIESLEEQLEESTESYSGGNTLSSEFKLEHFMKYRDDYNEWELEELLKNGRKYLTT